MQTRNGSSYKSNFYFCPNCHVQIDATTQICPTCNTRICSHCHAIIPSMTARVCPSCGKSEILKRPLKDMWPTSKIPEPQETFEVNTEYHCPKCNGILVLVSSRRLNCKSCGLITSLDEFLSSSRRPSPFYDAKKNWESKERIAFGKDFENIEPEINASIKNEKPAPTTYVETKTENNKWWKGKKNSPLIPKIKIKKEKPKARVYTRFAESKLSLNKKYFLVALRALLLVAILGLMIYGIYAGINWLMSLHLFDISRPVKNIQIIKPQLTITSINVESVSANNALISWNTNEPTSSEIVCREALTNIEKIYTQNSLSKEHKVVLTDLTPDTAYNVIITSRTKENSSTTAETSFKTPALPDTTSPAVSDLKISGILDIEAQISWNSSEDSYSTLEYGTSDRYGTSIKINENPGSTFTYKLSNLSPATTYFIKITTTDRAGNKSEPAETSFTTLNSIKTGYELGNRAPDFTLKSLDGKVWTLSQLRGKLVMVNFWNLSCGPCRAEMPYLNAVYETRKSDDFQLLTINLRDYELHLEREVNQNNYTFPILLDTNGDASYKYGISIIPMTFFIDENGIIRKIQRGKFESPQEIIDILNSL